MNKKPYKVLWVATATNFIAGLIYIWSVISKSLINDLNWTSKQASLPYTVITVSFVIAMVIFGKIQDMKGPKLTVTLGGILMGTGLILSGIFTEPNIMILTMGVIAGAGIGTINASTTPPVVKWFPHEKKGMVTGIVVAGIGLSSAFYSPLANYLIKTVGLSKTFIYIGVGALISSVLLAQFLENPPEDFVHKDINSNEEKYIKSSTDCTWQEMIKTADFYKLWLMLAFSSSAGLMIIGHISNIAKIQVNWQGGFILVILLAIFNTLGRVLGGTLSDKMDRINLMKLIFILQGINMFIFPRYSNVGLLSIGVAIAGLCYGAGFAIFPAAVTDRYGVKNFGINYGLTYTGWGIGGVIGPMTAATIFDATGNYNSAYIVAAVLMIIATIIGLTFSPKKVKIEEVAFNIKNN
ncbi:OFA family MFS transporter [Clostridium botulinum]|uniref:L-lactate MFS transporter n=1 Tax=Clostridium botulinum TaxID=1491 RepID=UPI00094746AA|nr:OFA family MFS transporter [Clostridium botulinum]APQ97693.1 major Facilitator Superfamily protein [Clostridium botulinum]MBN3361940.1 oxalate:formate antiporter [Clostridium botulinum]RUT55045.1 major Facilitator Superfamily protein [Clostridium botulinum]